MAERLVEEILQSLDQQAKRVYNRAVFQALRFLLKLEVQKMAWNAVREKKSEAKGTEASRVVEVHSPAKAPPSDISGEERPKSELNKDKEKDLASGMEMLDSDLLLSIVENTKGNDKNDVTMRRLTFDELLRREQLDTIDSNALKVYAINEGELYGKVIQCEAMKVLTERTSRKSKHGG